jgi:hypothetical protein
LRGEPLLYTNKQLKRKATMPSRQELNLRAYAMGFDPSAIANDSKLEQKVLFLEKNQTAVAITATAPTTTLTSSGVAVAAETFTIGGVTYTLRASVTNTVPNEIKIGAAATNTLDNIKDAINGTALVGAPGTEYSSATKRNPLVTAGAKNATTLVFTTTDTNIGGSTPTTETMTNFAFTGATMSAGTLGAAVVTDGTTTGVRSNVAGLSGDANVSL